MNYETINLYIDKSVATITLSRPEVRNALNSKVISELTDAFTLLNEDAQVRCIVMTGEGQSFCSGADLTWLGEIADYNYEQNFAESKKLVELLYLIHDHSKPVIAKVNGSAVGGGVGLMLVSDIIFVEENAFFGLSEVAIGIVPAAIVPLVLARIGETKARELLITGERINSKQALEMGLINYVVNRNNLNSEVQNKIDFILKNGPLAVKTVKEMMTLLRNSSRDESIVYISDVIAKLRTGEEGREGMKAFLEKREPSWRKLPE
ncbi:MAG: enoyl-CoA hydratase/isomerase family protein [Candidatus Kapabacteria bacterium]|nr:enoyl-CoA hydratase/isomerase family protein [Ignavibacteriota bacterium]MCW5884079.1 enoyl-CoA hydratase/isomerase family protein [Candidatus Kapabacteria bacterium]